MMPHQKRKLRFDSVRVDLAFDVDLTAVIDPFVFRFSDRRSLHGEGIGG